jgi:O-ureido-D-serine cyclo-ligase
MARPCIAVASSSSVMGADEDQPVLDAALREAGCDVRVWAWNDPNAGWSDADLVLIRSTWDYIDHHQEFCAWGDRVAGQTPLHNPPSVVRWNTDKHYLRALAEAGVAVTPTIWLEPGDDLRMPDAAEVVVKPCISAGSRNTTRHDLAPGDGSARRAASTLLEAGHTVMVQPYLAAVDHRGETGLVYVDGRFHHAFRKAPILVQGRSATERLYAPEQITPATATVAERALADRALAAAPGGSSLLYARVDVVLGADGEPVLMELELVEPSLFFAACGRTATALARAVVERLGTRSS